MMASRQINVKRALALAKAFNFLHSCATSCLLPFLTLYFRRLGLAPEMTGVVMGAKHLVSLAWRPLASLMARFYDKRRAVINGSVACSAAVALILLLFPPVDPPAQSSTCGNVSRPMVPANATRGAVTWHIPVGGGNSTLARSRRSEEDFLVMDVQHQLFFLVLITVCVWELVAAPLDWTADDGLYDYLDFADASDHYSSTGAWPLLGAACGAAGAGLLVSRLDCVLSGRTPRSAAHFFCYAGVSALALPLAAVLPLHLNKERRKALLKAARLVRSSRRALLCAVTAALAGMACSAVDDFLLWQMQDHGSTELHMGACLGAAWLSQAAFPFLAGQVSRLVTPAKVLSLAAAVLASQCLYYSFLWGAWAALPAQLLGCFGRGALWWAVRAQGDDVATPGAERSVKMLYEALSRDLGGALGSFAGGFVVRHYGVAWLFRGAAATLAVWCVCLPLLQWNSPRQHRINYSRLLAADASDTSDTDSEQERDWLDRAMADDRRENKNYGRRRRD
ncbi:major facilitator superfamily domain-containing protein 6-like [Nerophis ophidion]|uniref:major facilitator superfamily domain-containing protein 6-like n=1 Tax=Nerophis ophidion TaxID=159077 RepID=UPI002ADF9D98|nr:major facilitator superfamily domain-containing protein 6-like [Nerophis ophidion]